MADDLKYYGKLDETGLAVIAKVFDSLGSQVGSDVPLTENGSSAIYLGDMVTASVGEYGVRIIDSSSGDLLGQGSIKWNGTQEVDVLSGLVSDWTDAEKEQVRDALGVDGDKTTATGGQLQNKSEFDHTSDEVITDTASRTASQADVSTLATQASIDGLPTAADVYNEFTSGNNEDVFKADVSNLSADVNVVEVNGTPVTGVDDFKADASSLSADVNIVEVNGSPVTDINDFKADVSSLASQSSVDALPSISDYNDLVNAVANLNDPTPAEIRAAFNAIDFQTAAQDIRDAMGLTHTDGTPSVDAQLTEANNNHQNTCS